MANNPAERLKKRYTDDERANALAALAANGGKEVRGAIHKTAKELGIPFATLRAWAESRRHPEALQVSQEKLGPLADRLDALAHKIVGVLEDVTKLKAAPVSALASALSTCIDKMRLLREQPTPIGSTLTPEQRQQRLAELTQRARTLAALKHSQTAAAPPSDPVPETIPFQTPTS